MARVKAIANFGIAEWYGQLYRSLGQQQRLEYLEPNPIPQCRFLQDNPALAPKSGTLCSKDGGVCSIRNFELDNESNPFGPISATCPNRFLEDGLIVQTIGELLLGTATPLVAKEVPFLKRTPKPSSVDGSRRDVGKIDLVCAHPDLNKHEWCAVELQAVYFSGAKMADDHDVIREHAGNGIPVPGGKRRPDFRSSGPKRLMPQLQIKVPTLRRWGKKMVVVVDETFFLAMGPMVREDHLSNCDIVWLIVRFDGDLQGEYAKMTVADVYFTSLESAVTGLTGGEPATLPEFEAKLQVKLRPLRD